MKVNFREHFFFLALSLLVVMVGVVSYYRFITRNDYIVEYQGVCDPTREKCFIGCEDDACTKESYYSKVQKYAPDLFAECGKDITGCETANKCLPNDRKCSITYCDEIMDGSSVPNEKLSNDMQNNNQIDLKEEKLIKDNIVNNNI